MKLMIWDDRSIPVAEAKVCRFVSTTGQDDTVLVGCKHPVTQKHTILRVRQ
jgi:hypothetical protein